MYKQEVLEEVRKYLLDPARQAKSMESGGLGRRIRVEEVRSGASSPDEEFVTILYRNTGRPRCLFGFRVPAVAPVETQPRGQLFAGPKIWAGVICANFEELIHGSPHGLPEDCVPDAITWVN